MPDPAKTSEEAREMLQAELPAFGYHGGAARLATIIPVKAALRAIEKVISRSSSREKELVEGLRPFAKAAERFNCAIGPDGIDEGLTVLAHIHVRREYEAKLSTSDFSRARTLIQDS